MKRVMDLSLRSEDFESQLQWDLKGVGVKLKDFKYEIRRIPTLSW